MPRTTDVFKPVVCDVEKLIAESMNDAAFAEEWNKPDPEIEALDIVLKARKKAGLTQKDIARRMHTSQAAVSRIEKLGAGGAKNSPSVASLRRYASALGLKLKIDFVPASASK
jgi:DNA-binding XRE family transcriptional regulator